MYKVTLYYLWIAPHALLLALPLVMFFRGLHRKFPLFFTYAIYEVAVFSLLFSVRVIGHSLGGMYRHIFIVTAAGSAVLRFGIIQEIFNNIFQDYPRLTGTATIIMRWLTALLLGAAILLVVYSSGTVADNALTGVMLLDRSIAIIQAGLLLFLFLFLHAFGLSWRNYSFGLALGFGIFASTELAYWAMRLTDLSEHAKDLLDLLPTGSYHISALIWFGYFLRAEQPVMGHASAVPELDQWSGELGRSQ
jgi:hypothetical protein